MQTPLPPFVGPKQLAEMLGVSQRTVQRLVADGVLPAPARLRGFRRWVTESIVKHLEKQPIYV